MPSTRNTRDIELSPAFFTTVFSDAFLFGGTSGIVLTASTLSDAEKTLARKIRKNNLYSSETMSACGDLCNQTSEIFHWQDNSEGPLVFAGAILYFLRYKGKDVNWFIDQVQRARQPQASPPPHRSKKLRATLIVPTPEGILLTWDHKKQLLLPGGAVERNELPIAAAARELYEETVLQAQHLELLFTHESQNYLHHVFMVHRYSGDAVASSDAKGMAYLCSQSIANAQYPDQLTRSHQAILELHRLTNPTKTGC